MFKRDVFGKTIRLPAEDMPIAARVVDPEDPGFLLDSNIAKLTVLKRRWNYEVDGAV